MDNADGDGAGALFTVDGRLVSIGHPFDGTVDEISKADQASQRAGTST